MAEIKNPEQQTDKPSVGKSPEDLRRSEEQKHTRKDDLNPNHNKENTTRTENPEQPTSRSEVPAESKESQRKNALRGEHTEGKEVEAKLKNTEKTEQKVTHGDRAVNSAESKEKLRENKSDNMGSERKIYNGDNKLNSISTEGLHVVENKSPEKANAEWKERGYEKPPYNPNYEVKVVVPENKEFSRVYSYNADGSNNKYGPWLMDKKDVTGLSSAEIKDKYALPKEPTHICDVKVPQGFNLQTGVANSVEGWGRGGNQQYDTLGKRLPPSAFVNERPIDKKEV